MIVSSSSVFQETFGLRVLSVVARLIQLETDFELISEREGGTRTGLEDNVHRHLLCTNAVELPTCACES